MNSNTFNVPRTGLDKNCYLNSFLSINSYSSFFYKFRIHIYPLISVGVATTLGNILFYINIVSIPMLYDG